MKLDEFVAETIFAIARGMSDAQAKIDEAGIEARVNPSGFGRHKTNAKTAAGYDGTSRYVDLVEFDVAVTVASTTEVAGSGTGSASAGIAVLKASTHLDANASQTWENNDVSRIKFEIPVYFPQTLHPHNPRSHPAQSEAG